MPNMPKETPARWWMPKKAIQGGRKTLKDKRYSSRRWTNLSVLYRRENPLCVVCDSLAQLLDHITPVNAGGSFWDPNNHQSMCHSCHNTKSATTDKNLIHSHRQRTDE